MRLDVITIFPEYLDPLRHALLGKAIEQGILEVGVHNLRDFATGVHQAVDDSPYGGGPGMVMKPTVWGPALDAAADGSLALNTLDSAVAHRNAPRHDDVAGIGRESSYRDLALQNSHTDDSEVGKPLLIIPTPAGEPFTQQMAQQLLA